jgi:hypothetical protein
MVAMRWDSSRPVPWQRLMREWLIYVSIMAAILAIFFRDAGIVGALAGLLVSGPLYLLFGFVMAKFGYQRRSLKQLGTPRAGNEKGAQSDQGSTSVTDKRRPAPTRRTSGGGNRPKSKPRRR